VCARRAQRTAQPDYDHYDVGRGLSMVPTQSLLKRQLKRFFGNDFSIPAEWDGFIAAVDNAYTEFAVDRELMERSMELSSQELLEANSEIRAIFQAIPDRVFRLDSKGTILSVTGGNGGE